MKPILVALLLLTACSACAHLQVPTRGIAAQHNASVKITVECNNNAGRGTGVIISPTHVLTARHVVECEVIPGFDMFFATATKITVDVGDGVEHEAEVDITLGYATHKDIVRLKLKDSTGDYFSPIAVGPTPRVGDRVCEASMIPRPTYRCGIVQQAVLGFINVEMRVERGNSGSGLYDSAGRLVGIVVRQWRCEYDESCGGLAAPLQDYAWLIPN